RSRCTSSAEGWMTMVESSIWVRGRDIPDTREERVDGGGASCTNGRSGPGGAAVTHDPERSGPGRYLGRGRFAVLEERVQPLGDLPLPAPQVAERGVTSPQEEIAPHIEPGGMPALPDPEPGHAERWNPEGREDGRRHAEPEAGDGHERHEPEQVEHGAAEEPVTGPHVPLDSHGIGHEEIGRASCRERGES